MIENKAQRRARRMRHQLKEAAANSDRKRLTIFRSNSHIYAQVVDDVAGTTIASASTVDKELRKSITNSASLEAATEVGQAVAKRAKTAGVTDVYFDRGRFRYQGRVQALAEGARKAGLNF